MPLSPEEFFLFQHNGYLLVANALSYELIAQLERVIRQHVECRTEPIVCEDPDRPGREVSGDVARARVLRLSRILSRDPVFADAARTPKLLDVLKELLGANVDVLINRHNHVTLRLPGASFLGWHRDVMNWSRNILAAIFYLEDSTIESGCTWVLPGSHQMLAYQSAVAGHGRLKDLGVLQPQAVPVLAKAGDVLLCSGVLLHSAGANKSSSSRLTMTLGYHAVDELGAKEEPFKLLVAGERLLLHNTPGGPRANWNDSRDATSEDQGSCPESQSSSIS